MNSELKLFDVIYSVFNGDNDWYGHRARVFAKNENAAVNYIIKNYKQQVAIRFIEEIQYGEGTILK